MKQQSQQHLKEKNLIQRHRSSNSYRPKSFSGNLGLGMIIGGLSVLVVVVIGIVYQQFASRQPSTANKAQVELLKVNYIR